MEWTTVTVIIALTGLVVGIATPIVKLTSSITKFSTILENLIAQEKKAEDEMIPKEAIDSVETKDMEFLRQMEKKTTKYILISVRYQVMLR